MKKDDKDYHRLIHDETQKNDTLNQDEISNRVLSLFKYIQEINKLKQKTILNVNDYQKKIWCSELPDDPRNVKLFYQDRTDDDYSPDDNEGSDILLSVHKEDFESCPTPPEILSEWLKNGWNDYNEEVDYYDEKIVTDTDSSSKNRIESVIEFDEDPDRVQAYLIWYESRKKWAENQKRISENREIFDKIYSEYYAMKRDGETEEIIVANGILCDSKNPSICHPILTRRVKLDFDAENNTVFIRDTDALPELYTDVLNELDGVNFQSVNALQDDMIDKNYHPLDRNDTPSFLKVLIRQLSAQSFYSNDGIPDGWEQNYRFLIYNAPCFIVRKRQDGTVRAIERINEAIIAGMDIPKTLVDLVSGGKAEILSDDREYSIEEQLAMVGGESVDVLLSKEANREQLEIAQRIEKYNAVVVQGPPGTGKTHTIANLLGHFIAQGKSVLVTSHTTKALSVLKGKIAPGLSNLCVSLLDDSNKDMEGSVAGITHFISNHSSSSIKKEMIEIGEKRKGIIDGLAKIRKKIFMSIQKECELITYQGESLTPMEAAKFVALNQEKLDYIPGFVKADAVLPLTFDELVELYRSNEIITDADAIELSYDLPAPDELMTATEFEELCQKLSSLEERINSINSRGILSASISTERSLIEFNLPGRRFSVSYPSRDSIKKLKEFCNQYGEIDSWQQAVVIDGKSGGGYRDRWMKLVNQIETAEAIGSELSNKGLGIDVVFAEGVFAEDLLEPLKEVKNLYDNGGLPLMFSIFHKKCAKALKSVRVSGKSPSSSEECELAILTIELKHARNICNNSWNTLMVPHGVPSFQSLGAEPERIAEKYVHSINMFLNWVDTDYQVFCNLLQEAGIPENDVCGISDLDSDQTSLTKRLKAIHEIIPVCCDVCLDILNLVECKNSLNQMSKIVMKDNRMNSEILQEMHSAISTRNSEIYSVSFSRLGTVYEKYHVLFKRKEYLERLEPYAPDWVEGIRKHEGIHGEAVVRSDIMDAWKWRQLSMMLEEITSTPLSEYQAESKRLSKAYREITEKYAEMSGWYHLRLKTEKDLNLQQALEGWVLTVKKIGRRVSKTAILS